MDLNKKCFEKTVIVRPSHCAGKYRLLTDDQSQQLDVRYDCYRYLPTAFSFFPFVYCSDVAIFLFVMFYVTIFTWYAIVEMICWTMDRVGSSFPTLAIACYDVHDNQAPFQTIPDVTVKIQAAKDLYFDVHGMKIGLSTDKMIFKIMVWIIFTSSVLLMGKIPIALYWNT